MTASELIATIRAQGVKLELSGDKVRYCPRDALAPELMAELLAQKAEVILVLKASDRETEEVTWRVEGMRNLVPEPGEPIPLLVATEFREIRRGQCYSCCQSLQGPSGALCGYCSRAKLIVLGLEAAGGFIN